MGLVGIKIKEEAEKIALNVKNCLMTVRHDTTDTQEACVFKPPSVCVPERVLPAWALCVECPAVKRGMVNQPLEMHLFRSPR
jgi:hypothetical protein